MGYTPSKYKGTTARQRVGTATEAEARAAARKKNTVSQDAQNRTPAGRTDARRLGLGPTTSDGQAELPCMTPDAATISLNEPAMEQPPAPREPLTVESVLGVNNGKRRGPPDGEKEKAPARYDTFPLVSALSSADMAEAIELMGEDVEYQVTETMIKTERTRIKARLAEIGKKYTSVISNGGMRYAQTAVYLEIGKTKWTLDKLLLLENGVTTEQIHKSYKESKAYDEVRVVDLDKPRGKGKDIGEE